MAQRMIAFWRDIPAHVIVRQGRASGKRELPERFRLPEAPPRPRRASRRSGL